MTEPAVYDFKDWILSVTDFPKPGIVFRDITPVLASAYRFRCVLTDLAKVLDLDACEGVAGVESRGFILGAALAALAGKGFIPIRKRGKLPPPVECQSYTLEYGAGALEVKRGGGRVVVIDDVLATGGTMGAAIDVCTKAGYQVQDAAVLIDLTYLNQFRWGDGQKVKSLAEYNS